MHRDMTWSSQTYPDSPIRQHPPRPTYVPPFLRTTSANPPHPVPYSTESTHSESRFTRSRGRAGRGRGQGRGGRYTQWSQVNKADVEAEPFDELEVIGEDVGNGNSGINFDAYEDIPVETSGSNIPAPITRFDDVDLGEGLVENIRRCKYVKPTPIQKHAIPIAVGGRDLMACAQTGSGKTAAFCFPIISGVLKNRLKAVASGRGGPRIACPSALILSPTRELSCQIHEEAKKFAYNTGVKIVVAYGGAPIVNQLRNLEKGVDILVATPGRLVDMIERGRVSLKMVKYLALDEGDRMLDMGFEPQIRKIVQQMDMPPPGQRQTMLFSATFPHEIQELASDFLSEYIFLTVGRVGSSTELIAQRVELVQDVDKRNYLMEILYDQQVTLTHGKRALTLVFVETKRGADALEQWLSMNGFPAIAIHGDKMQMERERALRSFKSGATPILVATDVASRGLDIPHVSHVINFDLPKDIDDYVHRIGRTGRAGKSGLATAFFSDKNMTLAKALVELMKEVNQEVPSWLAEYAENSHFSGGGGGRSRRNGVGKFGGYDYRNAARSGNDEYFLSSDYSGADYAEYSAPPADDFGYSNAASANYHHAPSVVRGYETVVATGWDGWD